MQMKFILIGDSSVGKTSIVTRYSDGTFNDSFISTVGIDFKVKMIEINGVTIKLQIWDTAGQEHFRTITKSYYRGAHGILLIFDVSNRVTLNQTKIWMNSIKESADENVLVALVGNKIDLDSDRKISFQQGLDFAKENKLQFFEVSAKTGDGLNLLLDSCVSAIFQNKISNPPKPEVQERSGCRC